MNYYEHHIGDYAQATAHLSFVEDAAYARLLRKYYASEAPLPADVKQVQRLVGARLPAEKDAVEVVLKEFFTQEDDGWHNGRADREIAAYLEKNAAEITKRKNTTERQQRNRDRRAAMFAELAKHGIKPRWNAPMKELEAHLSRVTGRDSTESSNAPATDLLRRSSPDSNLQSPCKSVAGVTGVTGETVQQPPPTPFASPPSEDPNDHERWLACRSAYPPGTYREADWGIAERNARMCIEAGLCEWDQLRAAAVRYADQLRAMRKTGTQYVVKPSVWFHRDSRSWDEPFPLPAPEGKGKTEEVKGSGLPSLN